MHLQGLPITSSIISNLIYKCNIIAIDITIAIIIHNYVTYNPPWRIEMCTDDKNKSTTEVTTPWLGWVHHVSILQHNGCMEASNIIPT